MRRSIITLTAIAILVVLLAPGVASPEQIPGDIVFEREDDSSGFAPAYFPHWVHRIKYRCYVCHDSIFKMKKGANEISMQTIMEGKHCGTCHNGTIAWASDDCARCHVGQ